MPEGDTVAKTATVIAAALVGRPLTSARFQKLPGGGRLAGAVVLAVEPIGKHLLIHLDGGWTLRVHLGMKGRWCRYPPGQVRKGTATVELSSGEEELVCYDAAQVEVFRTRDRSRHPRLSQLGPDLLGEHPDLEEVVRRARRLSPPGTTMGEVLLDQRLGAGLGNVYKSELLFLGPWRKRSEPFCRPAQGVHPWTPLRRLDDGTLVDLYARAMELLRANLGGWPRTTTFDRRRTPRRHQGQPSLWVYERAGRPCPVCLTAVRVARQGRQSRSTYWCPTCQPEWSFP